MKARLLIALVVACSALVLAGTASASQLHAQGYPPRLVGQMEAGDYKFDFEGAADATCSGAEFEAELFGGPTEMVTALTPTSGCFLSLSAVTVQMNGCDWRFKFGAETSEDKFAGSLDLVCPVTKSIVIAAGGCEIQVPAQMNMGPIGYENLTTATPKPKVKIDAEITGLYYNRVKDESPCPLSGTGLKTNGGLSFELTLSAFHPNWGEPWKLWVM